MLIGDRLRAIRKEKNLSQGDIESRTGLLRCYMSRVENGQTVPSIETLEKLARGLRVPLWRIFYGAEKSLTLRGVSDGRVADGNGWGASSRDAHLFERLRRHLSRMNKRNRVLLLLLARKMALTHPKTKRV